MTERYSEYLHTSKLEERAAKNIYYWVMSTLESIFWGSQRTASFNIDLYANEEKIYFVFCQPTGKKYEFSYYFTNECGDDKLPKMLQSFVEIFNNIDYPLSEKISSPLFRADYYDKRKKEGEYKGYYHIIIYVDMLPNADN